MGYLPFKSLGIRFPTKIIYNLHI